MPKQTLIATDNDALVGVTRLCSESRAIVLRGMQILPEYQRQGIGTRLLHECVSRLGDAECYCIPWSNLGEFYAAGGFRRIALEDGSELLVRRYFSYPQATWTCS